MESTQNQQIDEQAHYTPRYHQHCYHRAVLSPGNLPGVKNHYRQAFFLPPNSDLTNTDDQDRGLVFLAQTLE